MHVWSSIMRLVIYDRKYNRVIFEISDSWWRSTNWNPWVLWAYTSIHHITSNLHSNSYSDYFTKLVKYCTSSPHTASWSFLAIRAVGMQLALHVYNWDRHAWPDGGKYLFCFNLIDNTPGSMYIRQCATCFMHTVYDHNRQECNQRNHQTRKLRFLRAKNLPFSPVPPFLGRMSRKFPHKVRVSM